MKDDEIVERLESYLEEKMGPDSDPTIDNFVQHAQGWSDHTYTFDVKYTEDGQQKTKPWAVRKYVPSGVIRSYMLDLEQHYRILEALQDSPLPTPNVRWLEMDDDVLGSPFFFMEKLEGTVPFPWSREGREYMQKLGENEDTCTQIVKNLAELHLFDWEEHNLDEVVDAPEPGYEVPETMMSVMRNLLEENRMGPQPIIHDAYGWLEENKIPSEQVCLTHGDYRPGNFLFKDEDVSGILDFETARLTDPMYDVAWVVALPNRMGSEKCYYMFDQDWFFEKYEEFTGWTINRKRVRFYEIIHQLRLLANWNSGAKSFRDGELEDLRHARGYFSVTTCTDQLAELLDYGGA